MKNALNHTPENFMAECQETMESMNDTYPSKFSSFLFQFEQEIFGNDPELKKIVYDFFTYLRGWQDGKMVRHNFLLTAPKACGKSEVVRVLQKILREDKCPIPVLHYHTNALIQKCCQGNAVEDICRDILNLSPTGHAFVFIDEMDALFLDTSDDRSVIALKQDLTDFLDGMEFMVDGKVLDSKKVFVVGLGTFQMARELRVAINKEKKCSLTLAQEDKMLFEEGLTVDDLVAAGCDKDLLARFTSLYSLIRINVYAFTYLIEKWLLEISEEQEILVQMTPNAEAEFYQFVYTEFGCNEVKKKLYETIQPALIEVADEVYAEDGMGLRLMINGVGRSVNTNAPKH